MLVPHKPPPGDGVTELVYQPLSQRVPRTPAEAAAMLTSAGLYLHAESPLTLPVADWLPMREASLHLSVLADALTRPRHTPTSPAWAEYWPTEPVRLTLHAEAETFASRPGDPEDDPTQPAPPPLFA